MIALSHFQAEELLVARRAGAPVAATSFDLGLSRAEAALDAAGVLLPGGQRLAWPAVEQITGEENACYLVQDGEPIRIQVFSEATGRYYSLMPTRGAPTMLISGIPMHRIKGTDPAQDTAAKLRAAGPLSGPVLDTCTGLGYTALGAAHRAEHVTTVELDPAVYEIIRCNPWSCRLFGLPNVTALTGDSAEVITQFPPARFAVVIHDPPMLSLGGDLYSLTFYREAHRVLRPRGRMFHYVGNPESKSGGSVTRGVVRRLHEAGFSRVVPRPEAFGVVAHK
jgi:predicted methyltransferase